MDARSFGPLPRLEWLPIDALAVDPTYQRDTASNRSKRLIELIATRFSWRRFQPVTVAPVGDRYAVVDGQHRIEGARRAGIDRLPCYVVDAPETADQAATFSGINRDRVAVNVWQLHYAQIAAGDAPALLIQKVCDEAGVTISRYPKPADEIPPLETMAVRTIGRCLQSFREADVVDALRVLAEAFPETGGQIRAGAIKGLTHFMTWHAEREIDWARLVKVVRDHDMADLETAAQASKALFGGKTHMAISQAITRAYNSGLRDPAKRLPETL